jgi:hypothetical protein
MTIMNRVLRGCIPVCLILSTGVAGGAVINVPAGGDLQRALNAAESGDTITLAARAVYRGNFTLPEKTGTSYVTITTAAPSTLPSEGQRITPATARSLPKIISPNGGTAIASGPGAKHYQLRGLEITVAPGIYAYDLVNLGSTYETELSTFANDFIVDQCYIHADPVGGKRGIALNGIDIVIKNSYLSNFKSHMQDAQAIAGWYGPGPYQIVNNYLEGAQSVQFGGAAPQIRGLVPSNIKITHNYMSRPLSWKGEWVIKNLIELKNAQNVTISDNILENNWVSAQNGYGVLFTVRTCDSGNYPWAVVKNIAFTYNIVRNSDQGVNILGTDNSRQGCPAPAVAGLTSNIVVRNNLFERMGGGFLQVLSGAQNVTVDHNTVMQQGAIIGLDGTPKSSGFVFTNNLTMFGPYGVVGSGTIGAITTLAKYTTSHVYEKNAAIDADPSRTDEYPAGNFFPQTMDDVEFVDYSHGKYQLTTSSPYHNKGTDAKDIGADIAGILNATATVVSGAQP